MDPQGHPAEVPAQLFRDSFRALQIEMRANALSKQIRDFAGEGSKRFKEWLNDIDRIGQALDAYDERYFTLAFQTLKNNAGSFFARYRRNNPLDTWAETREALIEQYSREGDTQVASQKLRRLQQKSDETVQNFGERIPCTGIRGIRCKFATASCAGDAR